MGADMPEDGRPPSADRAAFLGVSASLTGRRWQGPTLEAERRAEALVQATALPDPLARVLARMGVAPEAAESYLAPTLRDLLPDPARLADCSRAAALLNEAAAARARIAVFADYDVDGACSAALLSDWLGARGLRPTLYVPDRIDEGFGPNAPAMAALAADHDLIVCVDCGTVSHEAIAAADSARVIVLDHHMGEEALPPADAVVNPNRPDEPGELGHLCAAAVVFLTLVEANRQARAGGGPAPDLMGATDLVALATVADVAPLTGVNRAFVATGLRVMARRARPGLRALADAAGLAEPPRAHHLGYLLGPRINAGGRIGRADLGARLLSTRDEGEAAHLAAELDRLNRERREIQESVVEEALAQAEARGSGGPLAWAAGEGWHPGIVGIVAARLKEATGRPAVVIGLDPARGTGTGSARSVAGIDLGAAVHRLAAEGWLVKGGGHRMAAGLTVEADRLDGAMERLGALLARQGAGADGPRALSLEGLLMPGAATVELVEMLERAGPYGAAAPSPRFALASMQVIHVREVGSGHLKLTVGDGAGARLDCIAFGAMDGPLGAALMRHDGARFHLAGALELNVWNGRTRAQLRLEDAAPAG
ncbi:single-stranded-DNA-specific exonuclease RecJ [Rhodovulum sp. 12E13]|nr:single-stranded-DNA-specific exonuclease RecJ [Rhodovulum sp. 12E13]